MTRWLFRNGLRRGVFGGSRVWTYVAIAAGGIRLFNRFRGSGPEIAYREELEPGHTLVIHLERETGKGTVEVVGANATPS
ncbi:MAG: hypothetical protein JOZ37_09825 [Actinobacteria bacterium]|nr:hypothetical protein [Actinomycetota bacterium]MBV8958665.1 hypothetical protein [Actinomycetota bacterium]MBV9255389.1 hypothetical protein [Actinomycetota bacterium]MBV9664254.1 hypothetical protein [Actinomycetota bacterium]MBV9936697.1 hypothetical protein [Actinomycetota bacterium]